MSTTGAPIYCEVCGLPHEPGVSHCEQCKHALGTPPDWRRMEAELPRLRRDIALGAAGIVGLLLLNIALFGGAAYVVLLAPFVWTGTKLYRHATISKYLRMRDDADRR